MSGRSAVSRLPAELRDKIGELRRNGRTLDEILAALHVLEVKISRSALYRHLRKFDAIEARLQSSRAIAEALVATAVGLAVAIPAVVAYNFYQRHTRAVLGNTDALSNVLLAHLSGLDANGNGNGNGAKAADEDH